MVHGNRIQNVPSTNVPQIQMRVSCPTTKFIINMMKNEFPELNAKGVIKSSNRKTIQMAAMISNSFLLEAN